MKNRSKKRIKYKNIILVLFIIIVVIIVIFMFNNKEDKLIYMIDTVSMDINDVNEMLDKYKLNINISYEYSDIYEKNKVISQSIDKDMVINNGDELSLVVSLGKLDKDKLILLLFDMGTHADLLE